MSYSIRNLSREHQEDYLADRVWVSAEGQEFDVEAMTLAYIQNCLQYLGNSDWFLAREWIEVFQNELAARQMEAPNIVRL